jgi:hypothetical protein
LCSLRALIRPLRLRSTRRREPPRNPGRRFIKGGTSSVRQVRRRTPWSGVHRLRVRPSEPLPVHKTFAGTSCPGGHGIVVVGCTSLMCYRSHWGLTTPSEACTGKHTVPLGTSYLKTFAPIPPHPVPSGQRMRVMRPRRIDGVETSFGGGTSREGTGREVVAPARHLSVNRGGGACPLSPKKWCPVVLARPPARRVASGPHT